MKNSTEFYNQKFMQDRIREHKLRIGEVIFKTNELQFKAGCLISFFILNKIDDKFVKEVTSNAYSNFKLVTDILRRFFTEKYPNRKADIFKLCENMDRLGEIRNKFAHEFLIIGNTSLSYFPSRARKHIPWGQEGEEVAKLFNEFEKLFKEVEEEVRSLLVGLGNDV